MDEGAAEVREREAGDFEAVDFVLEGGVEDGQDFLRDLSADVEEGREVGRLWILVVQVCEVGVDPEAELGWEAFEAGARVGRGRHWVESLADGVDGLLVVS